MPTIDVPDLVRSGYVTVLSLSGGKDSTASALALREADVPFRTITADPGWEEDRWAEHIDLLREKIGPIEVVRAVSVPGMAGPTQAEIDEHGAFLAWAKYKAGFPLRAGRWCTEKLKLEPLKAAHERIASETDKDTVSVVGVRAEESDERAAMPIWEESKEWGGLVWRPIRDWPVADVIAIHHRHGIPLNPLYKRGHNRVGCYPCIMADKEEVRLVAKHAPERIALIAKMEAEFSAERVRRNVSGEGDFKHTTATFFQAKDARVGVWPIDRVVEWSRTSHGGRQLPMFEEQPSGGCFRWGLCEPPAKEDTSPTK
jgi:3'-phosphoadenosine 5'-phosphosulfate sulfotransferase (PAPS reductase)/FAD synthetase